MSKWHKAPSSQKWPAMTTYTTSVDEQVQTLFCQLTHCILLSCQKSIERCTRSNECPLKTCYCFGKVIKSKGIFLIWESSLKVRPIPTFIQSLHCFFRS